MCVVIFVALAGTAYLAVFFNRRAKADLQEALDPLAMAVNGSVDLDSAEVTGSYDGFPALGRMANASEGPGRVFQTDLLDAAGGASWVYTSNQHVKSGEPPTVEFTGPANLQPLVAKVIDDHILAILEPDRERFRVEYLRDQGLLRFVRSMRTRRDIPDAGTFEKQLMLLKSMAGVNRPFMETIEPADELIDGPGGS